MLQVVKNRHSESARLFFAPHSQIFNSPNPKFNPPFSLPCKSNFKSISMFIRGIRQEALKDWSDERLVAAYCKTNDQQYFTELFGRYTMQVFLICKRYLIEREDSRDMVMRIFSKLLEILPDTEIRVFRNWLPVVVERECLNYLRNKGRYVPLPELEMEAVQEDYEAYAATDQPITDAEIKAALSKLDEAQRLCLNLFFYKKMSYQQVSGQTGFALNEVKSYLQNGKRQLKKQLLNLIAAK